MCLECVHSFMYPGAGDVYISGCMCVCLNVDMCVHVYVHTGVASACVASFPPPPISSVPRLLQGGRRLDSSTELVDAVNDTG